MAAQPDVACTAKLGPLSADAAEAFSRFNASGDVRESEILYRGLLENVTSALTAE